MHDYQKPGRSVVYARDAMCCTSHPLAAKTALDILGQGGNAVDAAVAGAVVLGLCEPMMAGLGGDVFAMMRLPGEADIIGLNGSGRAPQDLGADVLRKEGLTTVPLESVHSITVPGAVKAFARLVSDFGSLALAQVLAPAIRYAENGIPVCHRSALDWRMFGNRIWGSGKQHYLRNGEAYAAGDLFTSAPQAEALRLIARDGPDAFYCGEIAEDMVRTLRDTGGRHRLDDFAGVSADYVTPISSDYRGYELVELPPNGQGATALLITKLLQQFDVPSLDPLGAERAHLEAEATKLAYAERNRLLGDERFCSAGLSEMLSEANVRRLADSVDPKRVMTAARPSREAVHRDTVYLCVVDQNRLCVSLIYSLFHPFGSGLASSRFGIAFQNRGAGFSLEEGHVNELQGGKRPLHTLIPGFLKKGEGTLMPFGVMGGPFQATGHAHFVSNIADFGMDLQEAIDSPRGFADLRTGKLVLETGYADAVAARLAEMGHDVVRPAVGLGGAQAISVDLETGLLTGASDQRKDGCALGM